MNTVRIDRQGSPVKMIAHRGLSGLERENTCAAFVAAGNREAYFGIETDVHCTADGEFVIIHDDNTLRVSGVDMIVENTALDTLRRIRLTDLDGTHSRADLVLPTLREYIGVCRRYEKTAVLELKNPMTEGQILNIMHTVTEMGYCDRMIVISFDLENLICLRRHYPAQRAQYLLGRWEDASLDVMIKYDLGLDIHHSAVTADVVKKVHAAGLEVNCWTVDDPREAARLIECGVDYITSNILE